MNCLCEKELYIFDMDGTIYLGNRVFGFAVEFIKKLRAAGKKVLFFTNNASHSPEFYYQKLESMGFEPQNGEILTSGDVTIMFILRNRMRHCRDKKVYLVGTEELMKQFASAGIALVNSSDKSADIVITSFDTTLTYEKLSAACRFIRSGAEYLSTHPDFNCPTETGFIPDSGAIAAFVTASTGVKPTYFGKPYPQTLEMICELTGLEKERMCVFGDRIYTDIALGKRNGVTSVLLLTGETTAEMLEKLKPEDRPDFVYSSLDEVSKEIFGRTMNCAF